MHPTALNPDDPGLDLDSPPITCPPPMPGVSPTFYRSKDDAMLAALESFFNGFAIRFLAKVRAAYLDVPSFFDELRRRGVDTAAAERIARLYSENRIRPRPRLIVEDRAAPPLPAGRGRRWRAPCLNY